MAGGAVQGDLRRLGGTSCAGGLPARWESQRFVTLKNRAVAAAVGGHVVWVGVAEGGSRSTS